MKFIHLSDLHIRAHDDENQDVISMLNFVSEKYPDHRLIVTGDIVDDGTDGQFRKAYALLQPFKGKIFICPGNHDFGVKGNFYSHERALGFDRFLAEPLNQGGTFRYKNTPVVNVLRDGSIEIMLIALDSNLETENPFDFACGEIGEHQLNALNTILASTPSAGTVKILFLHHHPLMVNWAMRLKDAEAFERMIYGRIDILLFGHKHKMKQWDNRWGIKYILASNNSPSGQFAKEITVDETGTSVTLVPINVSTPENSGSGGEIMGAFEVMIMALLKIFTAYNEYKISRDIQKLREFYELQKVEHAKIIAECNAYTVQAIVKENFDDLQVQINFMTDMLDLMVKNPHVSYLSNISYQATSAQYSISKIIQDIIVHEGTLKDVSGLLVSAVANAANFYTLCATSTAREEQLNPASSYSDLRQLAENIIQRNAELAMSLLRRRSDRRFDISSRPIGEQIATRPSGRPQRMLVYGYTFGNVWYHSLDDVGYPGRDNSSTIATVRTKMVEHQNSEFPKYPGVADIDQIIAQLPLD